MLELVTGGSGSGKSEYAEGLAVSYYKAEKNERRLIYLATMYPYDEECQRRVERHQSLRKGKGFVTIECYHRLEEVPVKQGDVLLLECMSNLLANEMYLGTGRIKNRDEAAFCQAEKAILEPVLGLVKRASAVVAVTNEVFSDGVSYEEETQLYLRLLGQLNQKLGAVADRVTEVVCSLPVVRKGGVLC